MTDQPDKAHQRFYLSYRFGWRLENDAAMVSANAIFWRAA